MVADVFVGMGPRDRIQANQCLPKLLAPSIPDGSSNLSFVRLPRQEKAFVFSSFHFPTSLVCTFIQVFVGIPSSVMEYHSVPPEERARDEDGNLLPWGYVYKEYAQWFLNLFASNTD